MAEETTQRLLGELVEGQRSMNRRLDGMDTRLGIIEGHVGEIRAEQAVTGLKIQTMDTRLSNHVETDEEFQEATSKKLIDLYSLRNRLMSAVAVISLLVAFFGKVAYIGVAKALGFRPLIARPNNHRQLGLTPSDMG